MYWKGSVGVELEELELELELELLPELDPLLPEDAPDAPPELELELLAVVPDDPIGCGGTTERMSFSNLLKTARTSRISLKSSWAAVVIRR
jgi:hypothetical protein